MISSFSDNVQQHLLATHAPQNTVLTATCVSIDGINYVADRVVSVGACAGLPEFRQIQTVRAVVAENDIRKVTFHERPNTLELKKRLDHTSSSASALSSALTLSSPRLSDTEILPCTEETSPLTSCDPWPSTFEVPYFSVNIEYRLRQGNLIYMRDGTRMSVSRDMKHDILQKLAEDLYKFSAYPQDEHFSTVAAALIAKHPCLAEPGSATGCYGWKNNLKLKMGHLRSKMQQNPEGEPPGKSLTRPRRSETNFFPDFPQGQDASTLEFQVNQLMNQTFSLRHKEIVEEQPSVKQIKQVFCFVSIDTDAIADVTQVPVGVLTVIPEDRQQPGPHALHLEPSSIALILEGNIVMDDLGSHAQTFCVTFGLIYNTFDFIVRVMLNLGVGNLRPKLQSLKNALLQ
uniref:Uncharacterized protein n=1 Tax=Seriola lalandi dorsalis TaxID=1841481 RepID=A0A3B4WHJ5_SERLL